MKKVDFYKMILTTTDSIETADKIKESLIYNKIAACVQVVRNVDSTFFWKNKVVSEQEFLIIIKTHTSKVQRAMNTIEGLHNYEIPEIISLNFEILNSRYKEWFDEICSD